MRVLGTAGHVDHGKSALVKALTGIDPDRLLEEQARQMTIDLGFAWMTLPSGDGLGIIDVPGHLDFIDNMLAGVGGIDAALLVVAVDEGVMPQTREHLQILDLLAVPQLIVAITKADLAVDQESIELVRSEVGDLLQGTRYGRARILAVSAFTGAGLAELIDALDSPSDGEAGPLPNNRPRLPIDRVFSMPGFGTVVTGTLLDGTLRVGDEVELLPGSTHARVRGLQTHKRAVESADPRSRVAVNLSGVRVDQVGRGDVLAHPGADRGTRLLDVSFRALPGQRRGVKHNSSVKLFVGSAQRMARVRVLQGQAVEPGGEGWLQLVLAQPVAVRKGDRFILRLPSPSLTLGGGQVINPQPPRLYKRNDLGVIEGLARTLSGDPGSVLLQIIDASGPLALSAAQVASGMGESEFASALEGLRSRKSVVTLGGPGEGAGSWVMGASAWQALWRKAAEIVGTYHREYPLRRGIPLEQLRAQLGPATSPWIEAMVGGGLLKQIGPRVALPEFSIAMRADEAARAKELLASFEASPYKPPSYETCRESLGDELLAALIEGGNLVRVSESVLLDPDSYRSMVDWIEQRLREGGKVTVAEVRDQFSTSRRYGLALLEHLDRRGVTVRDGDFHRRGPSLRD
jgi:selenocysteine-specific elongation factor